MRAALLASTLFYLTIQVLANNHDLDAQKVLQLNRKENKDFLPTPQFESPEHSIIGNKISLKYPATTINGASFSYLVAGQYLSFGDVIALAGDYFFDWRIGSCVEAISDNWDANRNQSLSRADTNVAILRTNSGGYLDCVLKVIEDQRSKVQAATTNGQDLAQVYAKLASGYDKSFSTCTDLAYVVINLCNPDHFGTDAAKAYSSLHTRALQKAQEAYKTQNAAALKEAYFIDGYGQHFLTDLFSAGHVRTPRRILHSTSIDTNFYPGDRCNQKQHDEDSALGLWVTNGEGQSWAAYGDKQYTQGRSAMNRQMVNDACQESVDEIWQTFQSGIIPTPQTYGAANKAPIPAKSKGLANFVPLFDVIEDQLMLFRQNVGQRGSKNSRQIMSIFQPNSEWANLRGKIEASGASMNLYVYTKSFLSKTNVLHIGGLPDKDQPATVLSFYGGIDAGNFGQSWDMVAQTMLSSITPATQITWTDSRTDGSGLYALVGRQAVQIGTSNAVYIGLHVQPDQSGQLHTNVLWNSSISDGNSAMTPGEILYGNFDTDSTQRAMIKYFDGSASKLASKLEFWTEPSQQSVTPSPIGQPLSTTNLNFLISHALDEKDVVAIGYSGGPLPSSTGTWYFYSWKSGYQKPTFTTLQEPNSPRAQALVSDPDSHRIIRVFYGKQYPKVATIHLDVLRPKRNGASTDIVFDPNHSSQDFSITWNAFVEQDYILWFVYDVNGDGLGDLVAYTSDASNLKLNVVVFPGLANGTFDAPVTSPIQLDPNVGQLLTGEFMRPLHTSPANYSYAPTGPHIAGGILSFFDNYGVIAARMIAPITPTGSFKYELKGQNSALAGQRSSTLGTRPGTWMGLDRKPQVVGLVLS